MEAIDVLTEIPNNVPLTDILLPCPWVIWVCNKKVFKRLKVGDKKAPYEDPNKIVTTLRTINDILYFLQLLQVPANACEKSNKMNFDMENFILMREGIKPIWEDKANSNGGTLSIKIEHHLGYDIFQSFVVYMMSENLSIAPNGISVTLIEGNESSVNTPPNKKYTFLKLWYGQSDQSKDTICASFPQELMMKISTQSIRWSSFNDKDEFNNAGIVKHITGNGRGRGRGGYNRGGRGRGNRY